MGPIVTPPLAAPRPRWALLVVAPLAIAAAVVATTRTPALRASAFDIDAYARLHRLWVADHGPGCARTMAHLAEYAPNRRITDPWGSELHLVCFRVGGSESEIMVVVSSNGPDRIAATDDDFTGTDYYDAGPLPGTAALAATERTLDLILHDPTLRPRDAWGSPIVVDRIGSTITAISPGPDRIAGTEDDLSVADDAD